LSIEVAEVLGLNLRVEISTHLDIFLFFFLLSSHQSISDMFERTTMKQGRWPSVSDLVVIKVLLWGVWEAVVGQWGARGQLQSYPALRAPEDYCKLNVSMSSTKALVRSLMCCSGRLLCQLLVFREQLMKARFQH
jgi:hypothetical protein